jgi:L-alanine-DL-glutamate epimerase-like enolase superfamily enzyme
MPGRIARVSAYAVNIPLPKPLLLGHMTIAAREYVITEVEDDEGHRGRAIGFSRGAPLPSVIGHMISPRWQNTDLDAYASTYAGTVRTHLFHGTHGIFWRALSQADCAVHDLLGQRAGQPLYALLGGVHRPVPTTLAGCYPVRDETPDSLATLMHQMNGYHASGIKITSSADFARDTERLRLCRAAVPDETPFIVDVYGSAADAASLLPHALRWADSGMAWVEDPFDFDDFENLALLAEALPYPVGVGDEQSGLRHFCHLIDYGQIGVVRLDATTCGGVTGFMAIARMAADRGLPISCHVFHHLHAQLAALFPACSIEYMLPETGVEAVHLLVSQELAWEHGRMLPSTAPGVGYVWDEDALAAFRV